MKPLLVIPPAPNRWKPLQELLQHLPEPTVRNLRKRLVDGVPGAEDVFVIAPSDSPLHGSAAIHKCGDVGVLSHVYTRPEQRGKGTARRLTEAVLSWFDMTGGTWLFLATTTELDETLYSKFGFHPIRRAVWAPFDRVTMLRTRKGVTEDPLADAHGAVTVRELTRADWPAMVTTLQYWAGPDPRVPLAESAVTAETFTLDLIEHAEQGLAALHGAFMGQRLVGMGTVALAPQNAHTYALLVPHANAPPPLREALLQRAKTAGFERVDFPMEALGATPAPDVPPPVV